MKRRQFIRTGGAMLMGSVGAHAQSATASKSRSPQSGREAVSLFLCGDVMTGRGIDQILPHPVKPHLFEPYVKSALDYVALAEQKNGRIDRPVSFDYVWGDALAELGRLRPDARIVNLETAVTASEEAWPGKGIHYRMHPRNVACLTAAGLDCCVLANNHALDWGRSGLEETLDTLVDAGIRPAGAGRDDNEAARPAMIALSSDRRVLVFAVGMANSGVRRDWAATRERAGLNFLADLTSSSVQRIARQISAHKRKGDIALLSIHWGENWGYEISSAERAFAHGVIDSAGVDIVHGHSSHHPKGIEVYRDRLILYGCGDFLNDYEGIRGHEAYRPDLALMFVPTVDGASGRLQRLDMIPTQIRNFRVNRARNETARWLAEILTREGRGLGTRVELRADHSLALHWGRAG